MNAIDKRATVILKVSEDTILRIWQQAGAEGISLNEFINSCIMERTLRGERLEREAEEAVRELTGGK